MRVLVTGHCGMIGSVVTEVLADEGHEVSGFDLADGDDVLDVAAVERAALGCGAIVHLAAIPSDSSDTPERIMATNVLGTWHVLLAAQENGVRRVVNMSSGQVLGVAEGARAPDYLPLDDRH
ncbi:MAG: SDR family oxidoreductase, partial [Actinomycetota bacterium]|nr:SDR family oxidoreductase [Actinomycetota bacterium]